MVEALTETQLTALKSFKEQIPLRTGDDDTDAFRFLRARQYNVAHSVALYRSYCEWRDKANVDHAMSELWALTKLDCSYVYHGRDKTGRPVYIDRMGFFDCKALVKKGISLETIARHHIQQQEFLCQIEKEATKHEGRLIEQCFMICDLDGCGIFRHLNSEARAFFGLCAEIDQNYYPERMGKLAIVNAPKAFPMAWTFIKPFLATETQRKIEVFGPGQAKATLLEHIEAEFVPLKYGGLCDCETKGCFKNSEMVPLDCLRYSPPVAGIVEKRQSTEVKNRSDSLSKSESNERES